MLAQLLRSAVRRATFGFAIGLAVLAGVFAASAQTPQTSNAGNGIVGIAIGLTADTVGAPARLVVEHVLPHGPAQAAGVHRGDEITAVDGQAINGRRLRDIVHMVRGKVGSTVTLTLSRKGKARDVTLKRVEPPHPNGRQSEPAQ